MRSQTIVGQQYLYGSDPSQFGQLWVPATVEKVPVVVLVHGGFWRQAYGLDLMVGLAEDLCARGYGVWNIEYGRVGQEHGGWPDTLVHVGQALDFLAVLASGLPLDLERVAVVGHSAGGHLALWSGSRDLLGDNEPGAHPVVVPKLIVGQGSVSDLYTAGEDRLGNGAVVDFLGGTPTEVPVRYAAAQPKQGRAEIVLVNGELDETVPLAYSMAPGIESEPIVVPETDHMALIDPLDRSWVHVVDALKRL